MKLSQLQAAGKSCRAPVELPAMDDEEEEICLERLKEMVDEPAIVRVANLIISQAIYDNATAIHIEQDAQEGRVRYRVNGVLHLVMAPPKHIFRALFARLKIMSNMDVTECRIPQDGLIHLRHEDRDYDLRVSSLPGQHGEKIVLKVWPADPQALDDYDLARLHMSPVNLQHFQRLLQCPHGLVLVSGPAGSGRTTMLYSCLRFLSDESRSLLSVEEDIRMKLPWVQQLKAESKMGLTVAYALRSLLRQDADVIAVDSIGDSEAARYALEAATGRQLVLAGIYASGAAQSLRRLIEMYSEPFVAARGAIGAVALRLARRLCPHCRQAYQPSSAALAALGLSDGPLYDARGCGQCRQTGVLGQCGLHEVMLVTEAQREVLLGRGSLEELRAAAAPSFVSLRQDGMSKVQQGLISPEEFVRVLGD
jgi:type II secretory ATPase GspE/PulE/Tfp pilus assembly ATPase PilB-like protein